MQYIKEYQEYIKKITDNFIGKLTYNSALDIEEQYVPKYKKIGDKIIFDYTIDKDFNITEICDEAPQEYDTIKRNPKEVVEEWMKIQNQYAIEWLNKNMITYDKWIKNKNKI